MKQLLSTLLLSLIFCSVINAQNLPNYLTDKEKEIYKNYIPPSGQLKDINPPPTPVRTMAEWEELQGTIITWVTSPTSYQIILRSIVGFAQNEGLMYIVCTDSNSVKSYLTAAASMPSSSGQR